MTSFLNTLQSELTSYVRKSLAITMVTKYIFSVFSKSLYNCTPTTLHLMSIKIIIQTIVHPSDFLQSLYKRSWKTCVITVNENKSEIKK